jgi:hypothetical protein
MLKIVNLTLRCAPLYPSTPNREHSPGGATELNPALQRWEKWKKWLKSRRDNQGLTPTL